MLFQLRRSIPAVGAAATVACLASAIIVGLGLFQIMAARDVALGAAERSVGSLSRALAQHAGRVVEAVDLGLTGIVDQIEDGRSLDQLGPPLHRAREVLKQALNIIVMDETGVWRSDTAGPHGPTSSTARDYFKWHRDHPGHELHFETPGVGITSGRRAVPLSRRFDKPDGSFAGLILATLVPEEIERFYGSVREGKDGSLGLWSTDARLLVGYPIAAGSRGAEAGPLGFESHILDGRSGVFALHTEARGDELVAFEKVANYPLMVSATVSLDEALSGWRRSASVTAAAIGSTALGLIVLGFGFERHRRRMATLQNAARRSEQLYKLLAENASDLVVLQVLDEKRCHYVSPSVRTQLGYEPDDFAQRRLRDIVHPDDLPIVLGALAAIAPDKPLIDITFRARRRDGDIIWFDMSLRGLWDEDGRPAVVANGRNVSERKAAELALQDGEARFRLLAETTSDVITRLRLPDLHRTYASPSCLAVFGWTPEELIDNPPGVSNVHPDDLGKLKDLATRFLGGEIEHGLITYRAQHKNGRWLWIEGSLALVRDEATGEASSIVASLRDVTERMRQADELKVARIAAEDAARVKGEFLANMSHELRTPLTGILGVHDLLKGDPSLTPRQLQLLDVAQGSGRSLLTIVNDILDFSKLDAGQLTIETVPFSIRALVEECRELGAKSVAANRVVLTANVAPETPDFLLGDPTRVRQLVLNLTNNAVKFTADGFVAIRVGWSASGLRLEVRDTGVGIEAAKISHLFERFSQADGSTARRFGGTGLGLAICRHLVGLMGGEIGVDSLIGQGSTFWFTLPLLAATAPLAAKLAPAPPASDVPRPRRVLLAEDNAVNQDIICAMLARQGHEITAVDDGVAAVEAFEAGRFDIVLMDVQMPGLSGLDATAAIRAGELRREMPTTPIVALTANAMLEDVERCRAVGMDAHVAKPIDWAQLFATIDRLCGADAKRDPAQQGPSDPAKPVLDERVLDELAGTIGRDRVTRLLGSFVHDARRRLALLQEPSVDVNDLRRETHALVSLAGQLGFAELSAVCAALERLASGGSGLDRVPSLREAAERATDAATRSSYAALAA